MEMITFRCDVCNQVLKVSVDKAGRKAKCKCGADVLIPAAPPPAAREDEGVTYGMVGDFSAAPKEEEKPGKPSRPTRDTSRTRGRRGDGAPAGGSVRTRDLEAMPREGPRRRHRVPKVRALLEPARWKKVCLGLNLVAIGLWIWLGAFAVREVVAIVGNFTDPQYAPLRLRWEDPELFAKLTDSTKEDVALCKTEFMIGLVTGSGFLTAGKWLLVLATIILLGAHGILLAGYARCLAVPDRYGSRGQVYALLSLGSVNVLFAVLFRLLPLVGAMDYLLIPVALPELALGDINFDRELPLSVSLSPLPMLDYLLAFFVLGCHYFELVLLAVFLRAIALAMKSETLEPIASGMIRLGLGTAFIQLVNTMLMITGDSDVLTLFMRIMYLLGVVFFICQLIWFARVALQAPPLIEKELDTAEEANVAVHGAKARARTDEDEDGDEDEDEDEDD